MAASQPRLTSSRSGGWPEANAIEAIGITKVFEDRVGRTVTRTRALWDVSLTATQGEFIAMIGPSGCGKSTLLRILAGLIKPTSGTVTVAGEEVHGPSPERAMVFQAPALLPWLTVERNIATALDFAAIDRSKRAMLIADTLKLVGLWEFRNHYPAQLSGGMQQRVGLARALAVEPKIMLMDEPFGALDAITRERLQGELLRLWEAERRPVFFVTHSVDEAIILADRIVVLRDGRLLAQLEVKLPRPRQREELLRTDEVVGLRGQIMRDLV